MVMMSEVDHHWLAIMLHALVTSEKRTKRRFGPKKGKAAGGWKRA
jgi:hypothetical protein